MNRILSLLLLPLSLFSCRGGDRPARPTDTAAGTDPASIHDITVERIDGTKVSLSEWRGKVLLIVNVASRCGFTGQYEGLQELYTRYQDRGLVVLGFPANDFLRQEPGTNEEIQQFCSTRFGVTFPMFAKISVKGRERHPLYTFLTERRTNPDHGGRITWNFNKFLVGGDGRILDRFGSRTKPEAPKLVAAIEAALAAGEKPR